MQEEWLSQVTTWPGDPPDKLIRADMVYFETPNAGAVFSVGSITFCGSLSHADYRNNISRIVDNVLRRFATPGYVKIAWTLRADPTRIGGSIFRTETRAVATDADARRKFRRYWSFLSPGIILIRAAMLPAVKRDAERRWREVAA